MSCSAPDVSQAQQGEGGLRAYQRAGGAIAGVENSMAVRIGEGSAPVAGLSGEGITPEEDIIWAPENPDEAIDSGLEQLWQSPQSKAWHQSFKEASQQSRQTGKALLIWFTDSMHSPTCRHLSEDVFSTPGFEEWATNHIVRLRVDKQVSSRERSKDIGIRKVKYIKKLIERYGVKGCPTVLLLKPGGEVYVKYRGYKKGGGEYYQARMVKAVVMIDSGYEEWRDKYEKRGYRLWESRDGRKTFAKLYRFKSGKVTLVDPDGQRGVTSFNKLSNADKAWIMLQKKKHEAALKDPSQG
ncbi:MAG: thioredoxin family protein [Akkermansiaceae bacterium]|nr:thioredoxin family protein [Akkermansiaceae bacterium]